MLTILTLVLPGHYEFDQFEISISKTCGTIQYQRIYLQIINVGKLSGSSFVAIIIYSKNFIEAIQWRIFLKSKKD